MCAEEAYGLMDIRRKKELGVPSFSCDPGAKVNVAVPSTSTTTDVAVPFTSATMNVAVPSTSATRNVAVPSNSAIVAEEGLQFMSVEVVRT